VTPAARQFLRVSASIGVLYDLPMGVVARLTAQHVERAPDATELFGGIWRGVWGVDGQYDFVRATFSDGTFVPQRPPDRLGADIYYRDTHWFARVNLLHAFAQNEFAAFDTATPGYNLLNAEVRYTFKVDLPGSVLPEMTIGRRGENLLKDDIRLSTSFKKDEVLQPGTNVRLFGIVKLI
jgi:iron complex outermembrane recepter protein